MSLMGKKLDRRRLSTVLTVLMIMFMMVSSVFTSKLIIAEDEGTDTDTDINLPIDDPQEAFLLKEHLNGESFVEVSGNRILLSDVSEENNVFDFFGDEAEFVLLLSVDLSEEDENEYTYTLPEGISFDIENIKTSDYLQVTLEGNVLTVKKVKVDNTPVDNLDDLNEDNTPVDDNNDDTQLDDVLDNSDSLDDDQVLNGDDDQLSDDGDLDVNTPDNNDENTNEQTDENTDDDTQNNSGTVLDLPEYECYVEILGTVLPETETFIVEGFGTFNKAAMMMLKGPLRAPALPPLDTVTIDKHLIGRQESASLYTYVRFGTQTFPLPKRVENPTEELDKSIEKLTEVPREVEVNLVWNVDLDDEYPSNQITKDTAFVYRLPDGIRWNWEEFPPDERVIRDTKNPSVINGHFEINQENNSITAYYSESFLRRAYDTVDKKFTTYINISGSVTEAMWDDTGDQPYHFEGVGYFDPEREEATTRIKVVKSLMTADGKIDGLEYLGEGKYKVPYKITLSGTYKTDDPSSDKRIRNVNINDLMPDGMLKVTSNTFSVKVYNSDGTPSDRGINCIIPQGVSDDRFGCVLEYIEDAETLTITFPLELDLNALLPDDENTALSDMTRRFENDVTVTATNPANPAETLEDTSITIDTYSMINPSKKGERDIENKKPEEVKWVIEYNKGKFAKDSREFGGINIGGAFVKDTMGEEQDLVAETFKFSTTVDGETWTEWTVTETEGRPTTISDGTRTITVAWEDTNDDGIENQFWFYLPTPFYELAKIEYSTKSTNEFTLVKLTNTASIASDAKGKDEKSGSGEAPGVGPGTVPMVKKKGDELGPDGNFEWISDLTVFEGFSRNVRYYDAMEEGLELLDSKYPIEVYRVTYENGSESLTPLEQDVDWSFHKNPDPAVDHTYDRKNPECETNPPWLLADLDDPNYSYNWYIEFVGDPDNDNILPADEYTDEEGNQYSDRAVYRVKYYTNAPMPEKDLETGDYKTKKFLNEGQIRTKIDNKSDDKDRFNSSDAELEKKYIEKASNDSQYTNVTHESVDTIHGYIGWYVRVYPLEAKNFVEIRDDFTYSTDQTSMKLVDGSVHVYVSENKNLPSSSEEIESKYYRISDSSTSGFTLRINNPEAAGITKKSFIYLFYQTKVDPRINNKSITYTNTATLNRDGDKNYPPAKAARARTDVVVSKGSQRSGQYVKYTIEINKQLLNIDPKNGILTVEDTRGESIEYIEGTMKFYEYNQETKVFEDVTDTPPYVLVSHDRVLEIKIPDETYVKIEYEALVTKKDGDLTGDDASNTVVIKGASGFSAINHLKGRVQKARAGAFIDTDHPIIKVVKTDRNYKPLAGAEFKFTPYEVDLETGELTQAGDPYEGFVSDENGVIEFAYDQEKEIVPEYDIVYVVEETKAPKGYQIDRRPKYILFTNNPEDYEGLDMFVLDGKEIDKEDVIIESVKFLYRFDVKNNLTPPDRKIPKTGVE